MAAGGRREAEDGATDPGVRDAEGVWPRRDPRRERTDGPWVPVLDGARGLSRAESEAAGAGEPSPRAAQPHPLGPSGPHTLTGARSCSSLTQQNDTGLVFEVRFPEIV